jgi:uncharacterized protein (TIGR02145 family)
MNKKIIITASVIVFLSITTFFLLRFINFDNFECGEVVMDVEGNEYKTIRIGEQCWFGENLKTTKYRNGEDITEAVNHVHADGSWNTGEAAHTWYNYQGYQGEKDEYVKKYGYLYNWHVIDKKNVENNNGYSLCPNGWNVPTHDDWTELERFICENSGNSNCERHFSYKEKREDYYGTDEGRKLKSIDFPGKRPGADDYGFNALPGGIRYESGSFHSPMNIYAGWWSSTGSNSKAWIRSLYDTEDGIGRFFIEQEHGYAVRCLKK